MSSPFFVLSLITFVRGCVLPTFDSFLILFPGVFTLVDVVRVAFAGVCWNINRNTYCSFVLPFLDSLTPILFAFCISRSRREYMFPRAFAGVYYFPWTESQRCHRNSTDVTVRFPLSYLLVISYDSMLTILVTSYVHLCSYAYARSYGLCLFVISLYYTSTVQF